MRDNSRIYARHICSSPYKNTCISLEGMAELVDIFSRQRCAYLGALSFPIKGTY